MFNLYGEYKVDIYNQDNELVESSDYFSNFITTTGLSYPYSMPFADTFKWLSLGLSSTPNTIHTTGLGTFINGTDYKEARTGEFSYTTGFFNEGCGFIENLSGVDLYRAWRIPQSGGSLMKKDLNFKEIMVTPGRRSGIGVKDDFDFLYTGGARAEAHTSGLTAFSRVVHDMTIPSGDWAVITYKLGVTIDLEVKNFNKFIGLYEADHSKTNGTPFSGPVMWQSLTGQARVLHPGIRVIEGAVGEVAAAGGDDGSNTEPTAGETIEPAFKSPMEPFESGEALGSFFSTDNTQWLLDPYLGGKVLTGAFKPWNELSGATIGTGFPEFYHDIYSASAEASKQGGQGGGAGGGDKDPDSLKALRESPDRYKIFTENFRQEKALLPSTGDYQKEAEAGKLQQGGYSWNSTVVTNFDHDTTVFKGQEDFTTRKRDVTRVSSWLSNNAKYDTVPPYNYITYRSLVFCGVTDKGAYYPFFDSLFGTHDDEFLPTFHQPTLPTHDDFTFTGTTGYYPFQDGENNMNIKWQLSWSSPCGDVANCVDP